MLKKKREAYQKHLDSLADSDKDEANTTVDEQAASMKLLLEFYIKQATDIIDSNTNFKEGNEKEITNTEDWINQARDDLQKWLTEQQTALMKRLREGETIVLEWQTSVTGLQQAYRNELHKQLNARTAVAGIDMSTQFSVHANEFNRQAQLHTEIYETHPGLRPDLSTPNLHSLDALASSLSRPAQFQNGLFDDLSSSAIPAQPITLPSYYTDTYNNFYDNLYKRYERQTHRSGFDHILPQMPLLPAVPAAPFP